LPKLTDAELIAAIEAEEALALDQSSGLLADERADALARYRGELLGNEQDGRSQVVDKSVFDTIEWIMPSLTRIYLGGDEIGRFEARGPEDEDAAKRETEVCNWYLEAKNDFFSQINATLRDALLLKNGYMVGYWQCKYDTMTEVYERQSDEEVALLMQDEEVEIVEHTEYPDPNAPPAHMMPQGQMMPGEMAGMPPMPPPMLHDVKVERKACEEYVAVESIPPEEMLVSRRHRWTSLMDADFVQWRRRVTIGQLRAEGFEVSDDLPSDEDFNQEGSERERYLDVRTQDDETPDPSRRMVTFNDTYIRIDLREKGTPQLWRVCYVGGTKVPVLKEEADIIPFAAFSPIIYPHSHIGMSVYDLINDVGIIKTTLQRQFLDNVYQQNAGERVVDVTRANLDDFLTTGPGRIKRVEGNPSEAVFPLVTPDVTAPILGALEYMDSVKEGRTGVTRYSAGLDANTLNKTATGVQAIQSAANQRIEMIARTLAGGFKDLFLIVHALALKHSTKQLQIKLRGNWVQVNPREWKRRTDFAISVGLGTGTPEQQIQKLMALGPVMQSAAGAGLVGPQETYNFVADLWKAAGYKNPDKFVHQPPTGPDGKPQSPPPQKPPEVMAEEVKAQAHLQGKQMDMQAKGQETQAKFQMDMQLQQSNDQRQAAVDQNKAALERERMDREFQLEMVKMEREIELERWKKEQDVRLEMYKADIMAQQRHETAVETARLMPKPKGNGDART
jgi:hypothetical protein